MEPATSPLIEKRLPFEERLEHIERRLNETFVSDANIRKVWLQEAESSYTARIVRLKKTIMLFVSLGFAILAALGIYILAKLSSDAASLRVELVQHGVDASGNLTKGEGADLTRSVPIKDSAGLFCSISKAASYARGDNAYYQTDCSVARNAQNQWTAAVNGQSTCRVSCVGMQLLR
jgi:hypothetical protein